MGVRTFISLLSVAAAYKLDGTNKPPLNGWEPAGLAAPPHQNMTVTIWLHPEDPDALEQTLLQVSNPYNQTGRFRRYLSKKEISDLVKPRQGAEDTIVEWTTTIFNDVELRKNTHGDMIDVTAPADKIEQMFGVKLQTYTHPRKKHSILRALSDPVVPASARSFVRAIFGLYEFLPVPMRKHKVQKLGCDFKGDIIDPNVLASQYKFENVTGGRSRISQGVAAFEGAQFTQTDVDAFQKAYNLPPVQIEVKGPNNGGYFGEAGLDTQYIAASGRGVASWYLSQQDFNLLTWCELVMDMPDPPSVLSISWGGGESQYNLERQYAANSCFQKLGLMGISIFAASGDDGTGKQGFLCKK